MVAAKAAANYNSAQAGREHGKMGDVIQNTRFAKKTPAQRARWEKRFARRTSLSEARTRRITAKASLGKAKQRS